MSIEFYALTTEDLLGLGIPFQLYCRDCERPFESGDPGRRVCDHCLRDAGPWVDAGMLADWLASGVVRDYADTQLRALYRSLLAREERNGWLPEPDATMLAGYGAELSRRAQLSHV
jgi:hypothetical protein